MRIAVDAMGGDHAPGVIVEGAIRAEREFGCQIALVGREDLIKKELRRHRHYNKQNITIEHAEEVIEMHEPAALSMRKKKKSSIHVAVNLLKNKEADAFVSAGNTGAVVCVATLTLGLLPGVQRPGIALVLPTLTEGSLIIDVGANIDCKPEHLLQYAVMGDVYSRYILGRKNPSIGLLNVGEEEGKGTDQAREAYRLLDKSFLNFIGNIEGRHIYAGSSDVIICDGFVGNVALKISESLAETLTHFLKKELRKSFTNRLGALLSLSAFRSLKRKIDYSEQGGAWLLGIDGRCVISHGSSNVRAIKNAIRVAGEFIHHSVNKHIVEGLERLKADNTES